MFPGALVSSYTLYQGNINSLMETSVDYQRGKEAIGQETERVEVNKLE